MTFSCLFPEHVPFLLRAVDPEATCPPAGKEPAPVAELHACGVSAHPLTDLQAFEAAARHSSFTRAAQELCVTQGAVSKQVKHLEAFVGVELFLRIRQGLVLTEAGRAYLAKIQAGLGQIEAATVELIAHQARRHAEPDLYAHIRRALADPAPDGLHAPAPGHPRRIPAAPPGLRFLHPELDAAVRFGEGSARQRADYIVGRDIVPVYSPRLIPAAAPPPRTCWPIRSCTTRPRWTAGATGSSRQAATPAAAWREPASTSTRCCRRPPPPVSAWR